MQSTFKNMLCRFLVIALMLLPFQNGYAGMIGADQVNSTSSAQLDRANLLNTLSRADTVSQFQAFGLDAQSARDRVAAMSDDEVRSLAGKVHAAPAGGDGGTVVMVLLIAWAVWYFAFRR